MQYSVREVGKGPHRVYTGALQQWREHPAAGGGASMQHDPYWCGSWGVQTLLMQPSRVCGLWPLRSWTAVFQY